MPAHLSRSYPKSPLPGTVASGISSRTLRPIRSAWTRYRRADTFRDSRPVAPRVKLAALLPIRERLLGPEHPTTLNTRGQLAYWTEQAVDAG